MYTVSSKIKTFSLALMIIGALGVAYSFLATPSSIEDVKVMLKESHDAHGGHEAASASHDTDSHS